MVSAREVRIDTSQGRLAGLAWSRDQAPRVLCLHGWLDNAASFLPLADYLKRLDIVALDLPGHGHSEHRHPTTRYHFIDYLFNVDAALDALGWNDCHLLGHSLGAAISSIYSAGAPDRVRSTVLLDALGPISVNPDGTTDRLRRSLFKNRQGPGERRRYESVEAMAEARGNFSGLSKTASLLICQRAARRVGEYFEWRSDPALNWISSLVMTRNQALDLLRHIEAPVLSYTFTPESPWASRAKMESYREAIAHGRHLSIEGSHHLHMDSPGKIADTIQRFILENDRPNNGSKMDDQDD